MKTIEPRARRASGAIYPGPIPLPQRWRRARSWGARYALSAVDIASLKLMLKAEAVGRG